MAKPRCQEAVRRRIAQQAPVDAYLLRERGHLKGRASGSREMGSKLPPEDISPAGNPRGTDVPKPPTHPANRPWEARHTLRPKPPHPGKPLHPAVGQITMKAKRRSCLRLRPPAASRAHLPPEHGARATPGSAPHSIRWRRARGGAGEARDATGRTGPVPAGIQDPGEPLPSTAAGGACSS